MQLNDKQQYELQEELYDLTQHFNGVNDNIEKMLYSLNFIENYPTKFPNLVFTDINEVRTHLQNLQVAIQQKLMEIRSISVQ